MFVCDITSKNSKKFHTCLFTKDHISTMINYVIENQGIFFYIRNIGMIKKDCAPIL